ncbi:MAG: hypothetical protein WCP73_09120 [Eubacteriales bacterium]
MTLGEAKSVVYTLLDSKLGTTNALAQSYKFNGLFNITQKELATIKYIKKIYKFSHTCIPNLLEGDFFTAQEHWNTDVYYTATGALAYAFEVDDNATITISKYTNSAWTTLATINHIGTGEYVRYKGLISNANGDIIKITFSGTYFYRIRNIALFGVSFTAAEKIPDYEDFIGISMPDGIYKVLKITKNDGTNEQLKNFYWEGIKTLRLDYSVTGDYTLEYAAYPTVIATNTPDSYEFEITADAQEAMPYFVAANCVINNNDQRPYADLLSQYQAKAASLVANDVQAPVGVQNRLYGGKNVRSF